MNMYITSTYLISLPLKILIPTLIRLEEKRTHTVRTKNAIFRRVRTAVRKVTINILISDSMYGTAQLPPNGFL
jgi:hypothetical protein